MTVCPTCYGEYERLGRHWRTCGYPEIPQQWKEILTGLLMGDGCVTTRDETPKFILEMTCQPFVEWVRNRLWWMFSDLQEAGKTRVGNQRHRICSYTHEGLTEFADWYVEGEKRYPSDLELTPLMAKMWYVTDGGLRQRKSEGANPRCAIACHNESSRPEYLISLFEECGFSPSFNGGALVFSVKESKRLLDWMGTPPRGFGYKWEEIIPREVPTEDDPWKDPEWLYEEYHNQGKNYDEIAKGLDISRSGVGYWMEKHGIEARGGVDE